MRLSTALGAALASWRCSQPLRLTLELLALVLLYLLAGLLLHVIFDWFRNNYITESPSFRV